MSPPACSGTRKGSAKTIASGRSDRPATEGERRGLRRRPARRCPRPTAGHRLSRRSTIWAECHWSPRIRTGKRTSASSIAAERSAARAAARSPPRPQPAATRTPRRGEEVAHRSPSPWRLLPHATESRHAAHLESRLGSPERPVQAHHAAGDQRAVLAEQFDPQLVAARRGGAVVAGAAVPVEGEEAVALQVGVAGEGDDQLAARLDDLDVAAVGAGDAEADPDAVEAAVAVRGEGADRRGVRVRRGRRRS